MTEFAALVVYAADPAKTAAFYRAVGQQMPWGCRILAEDPGGRPVEVNQRGHCPASPSASP